jgi:catechol 2,3-dioxygenase-like lactoylglutathione lyase family enzyme
MKIHHIAISVKDSDRITRFYKENFGFREVNRFTKPGWDGGAVVLQLGDLQLEVFQFKSFVDNKDDLSNFKVIGLKHIGIQVENVNKKYKELKSRGVDIDEPVKGTTCAWFCFLRDPNGIPVELIEPMHA